MRVEYSLRQRRRLWLYTFVCPAVDRFARIVRALGPPEELFDNPPEALLKYVSADTLARMRRLNSESYIDALLERLRVRGVDFVCRGDPDYPERLEELDGMIAPPELLFVRGDRRINIKSGIAVVGTRDCSSEGVRITRSFARDFARAGAQVISGMAVGIDAAAVQGALEGGGRAIGVLGCGVDVPYPANNQALVRRMLESGGTLISEYMPGMRANKIYFPARNRVIAGLALGALIVEAPARSGAINTVSHALNLGREVFVVPGSVLDARYAGSNALLREGAAPALNSFDVLEPLGIVGLDDRERFGALDAAEPPSAPDVDKGGSSVEPGPARPRQKGVRPDGDKDSSPVKSGPAKPRQRGVRPDGDKDSSLVESGPAKPRQRGASLDGDKDSSPVKSGPAKPRQRGVRPDGDKDSSLVESGPAKPRQRGASLDGDKDSSLVESGPAKPRQRGVRPAKSRDAKPDQKRADERSERGAEAPAAPRRELPQLEPDERRVVELLREREHSFDEMASETEFDAAKLNSLLTMLKIKRIIYETTGKHFRIDDALR